MPLTPLLPFSNLARLLSFKDKSQWLELENGKLGWKARMSAFSAIALLFMVQRDTRPWSCACSHGNWLSFFWEPGRQHKCRKQVGVRGGERREDTPALHRELLLAQVVVALRDVQLA